MKRLLTTVAVSLAGIQGITLEASSRPTLVVGIMVDQLRTDYLENLRDVLSSGGFRRLMDHGLYLQDVDFHLQDADPASATALVQTGTYPRNNGIVGSTIYNPTTKSLRPVFHDDAFIGNFTSETYSPSALKVTTISDEIAIENGGKNKIHSISPDAAQAIILAGHSGSSAFWVNDETGKWSSTTYYTSPPSPLQKRNYNSPLINRLDTMRWTPLKKGEAYPYVPQKDTKEGFRYSFSRSDRDVFKFYKLSPYVNADITDAAVEYITDLKLGKNGENTDVLNIAYTLAPYPQSIDDNYRYELSDAYLRLDKDLEKLFNALDKYVGKANVLVYLVSTGYFAEPVADANRYRLSGGTFSVKRAISLLNAYLAAKYGNGSYVDQFANSQVYLSKKLLEEKKLDYAKVAQESRDFLVRMSGVSDAFTMADLMSPAIPELENYRQSLDPQTAGDIVLAFTPGWKVVDDSHYPVIEYDNKTTVYPFPGFLMGPGIAAKVVETPVDATSIAPTVARNLRIRAPNAARDKPLSN